MNTEKMQELAKQYLNLYCDGYQLDLAVVDDRNAFLDGIENFDVMECQNFMEANGLDILQFPEFHEALLQELDQFIKDFDEKNQQVLESATLTEEEKELYDLIDKYINSLSEEELPSTLLEIENESSKEFEKRAVSDPKLAFYVNGMKNTSFQEIQSLLIHKMKSRLSEINKYDDEPKPDFDDDLYYRESIVEPTEVTYDTEQENTSLSVINTSNFEKYLDELIANIPFNTSTNVEENYVKISNNLENLLKNEYGLNKECVQEILKSFERKYNEQVEKLNYYRKMIETFNTFNYDHLPEEDKQSLLNNIKNGQFLSEEDQEKLNITEEELENLRNDMVKEFENINNASEPETNEEVKITLINKYLDALKRGNETLFESLQAVLNVEKMREREQMAEMLSDEELEQVITEIKKQGIDITFEKIIALPEVEKFYKKFCEDYENVKSIKDAEKLQKNLADFAESKVMLGLTDFNKALLVAKLNEVLANKKEIIKFAEDVKALKEAWKNKISQMETKELMPFYKRIPTMTKEELEFENLSDDEVNIMKEILGNLVLDELANRILKDLKWESVENLDELQNQIANWKKEDFAKYEIPEELEEEMKTRLNNKIMEEKTRRQTIKDKLEGILEIGTPVQLTKEVSIYENNADFITNKTNNKKKLKQDKKGTIGGYVLQKEAQVVEVTKKEDLKNYLQEGYEFKGYRYDYKNFIQRNKSTYVKPDEVAKQKLTKEKKWKKILRFAILPIAFVATMAAAWLFGKNNNKQSSPITTTVVPTITNTTPPVVEDQNYIYVDDEKVMLEQDVINTLNSMPGMNANFSIDNDARIWDSEKTVGVTNGYSSYFNTHNMNDVERYSDGYVLRDSEGNQKLYTDRDEIANKIIFEGYDYVGPRALNEFSKSSTDYEGIFEGESVDFEASFLDELQGKGVSRCLTK
ncbi:MAG: hypothetical protein HFI08_06380 [Bacilli bacterium]|nr:hypothetical protein [Bacilli bacterium]